MGVWFLEAVVVGMGPWGGGGGAGGSQGEHDNK